MRVMACMGRYWQFRSRSAMKLHFKSDLYKGCVMFVMTACMT